MSGLVASIRTCTTIEQLINTVVSSDRSLKDVHEELVHYDDNELLAMIKNHIELMYQMPYEVNDTLALRQPCSVNTDVQKMDEIKKLIKSCFEVIGCFVATPVVRRAPKSDFARHVISLRNNELSMLELDTSKWTMIRDPFKGHILDYVTTSVVYARGNIYVFGGIEYPQTWCSYSLKGRVANICNIWGLFGGRAISTCYSGDKLIYLVGGYFDGGYLNRVDSFNIATSEFKKVGQLPLRVAFGTSFFHNKTIYIVGGETKDYEARPCLDIHSFNIQTGVGEVYQKDILETYHDSSCFDGNDYIYILTAVSFFKYSLTTRQSMILLKCPTYGVYRQMVYDGANGNIIYIGGKGPSLFVRNVQWVDHD
ncbi:hypothetical protein SAMD00019534_103030 [Acytostelium subglobosum LB1]|uniref:hypothetical protein n=1 Tax=Acytostelium subglobosum LB1 TaxID=1410327 RepID=UPI000644ABE8|nr:hypothetical protein SAMD00019534_103030 [Acytostelium subglobosum LB1]GAM27128.1 hypothetical protein SAMD00019534_103030 [Acytostelium subglobosum LB1]|eukprot:XP_012750008.1 hypothetical protein SAMD00019534_103030 [Acytostelium subglobosum LB1]